jgi:adenylate kinase
LHPPKVDNDDDLSGPLIQRDDDQEATVARRLDVYIAQTRLLIEY